jgi:hypothetical protein
LPLIIEANCTNFLANLWHFAEESNNLDTHGSVCGLRAGARPSRHHMLSTLLRKFRRNSARRLLALAPLFASAALYGGQTSLGEIDFSAMQINGVTSAANTWTSGKDVTIPAHGSMWIDLHGAAKELTATVEAAPNQKRGQVRLRVCSANAVREFFVFDGAKPQRLHMMLNGDRLLTIESLEVANQQDLNVTIKNSVLSYDDVAPSAWTGVGPIEWTTSNWDIGIDGRSGGIMRLENPQDKTHMAWLRPAAPWGTGWIVRDGSKTFWDHPSAIRTTGARAMTAEYDAGGIHILVTRELRADGRLAENYVFENRTSAPIALPADGIGVRLPLPDSYPNADVCLRERCHVHLAMCGRSAFVTALRMGGYPPNLGLVLTEGSLVNYSIDDRIQHSNDRGQFVVHPPAMTLAPGQRFTLGWVVFWHQGLSDFFAQAQGVPGFVRLSAPAYAVTQGHPLQIRAEGDLRGASVRVDGEVVDAGTNARVRTTNIPAERIGEHLVEVATESGTSFLRAYVAPDPWPLIKARVRFIIDHQQRHAPGNKLDGAYLIFDNETKQQVYDPGFPDHDAGRERLAMGTLLALYAKRCDDPQLKADLDRSLAQYAAFVKRELQSESGFVFNDAARRGPLRLYNFPWLIQFYLAMNEAYPKPEYLRRALDACRSYYDHGGARFYCIGMPVRWMVESLKNAGWEDERKEMLAMFRRHAGVLLGIGTHFPPQEVNYEESIVGPAVQLMLEVYTLTGEQRFLDGAREQLRLLELFGGPQPDYHLHDIAIRHWDDYWFGKRQMYGDTLPHYWSTLAACSFALYADATNDPTYRTRGESIFAANFSQFRQDGSASCAYVFPLTINGKPGAFFDPWANDQDWALVNWMLFSAYANKATSVAGVATADNF